MKHIYGTWYLLIVMTLFFLKKKKTENECKYGGYSTFFLLNLSKIEIKKKQ